MGTYRLLPMTFLSRFIGDPLALGSLARDASLGQLSHASLLEGPEGMGKWTLASGLAKSFFCPQACGHCDSCRLVESGAHPDVTVLADDGESLKIETVRELIQTVHLRAQGGRRCVLIEHAERMKAEAQNALLKTLEEPPGSCFLILTSADPGRLLPTVISRLRVYALRPLPDKLLEQALISGGFAQALAPGLLDLAQGRPGLALDLLGHPQKMADCEQMQLRIEQAFSSSGLLAKMELAEALEKDSGQLDLFFRMGWLYLRKTLHQAASGSQRSFSSSEVAELFESFLRTRYLISGNINKRLALEQLFLGGRPQSIRSA